MEIQESGEMYLETILILSGELEHVRSLDVANYMNFSKPSVSRAVSILKGNGFINVDENGYLTLTDKGSKLANKIYERHQVLTKFFMSIGVDEKTSTDDACRIEHFISDKTFEALKKHMAK